MITIQPVGRLTKDADLRYGQDGTPRARFTLACKRRHPDKNGKDRVTFIQGVIFGKSAEAFASYTRKGALVSVFGELVNRSYDDQQGITHYITEIVVENFEFLESKEIIENRKKKANAPQGHGQSLNEQEPASANQNNSTQYETDAF